MRKNIIYLYQKELKSYFYLLSHYIFSLLFVFVSLWLFFQTFFIQQQADLSQWFSNLPFLFLFFLPALAMGSIAEEKKSGTWEVLISLPITEKEVIIAKFLAALTFVLVTFFSTISLPVTVFLLGKPDIGVIFSSTLGVLLLAAGWLSVVILASSLTQEQSLAFLLSLLILLVNDIFSQPFFLLRLPSFLREWFSFFSLSSHYQNFTRGLINLTDLLFFIAWIFLFLNLAIIILKRQK